MTNHIPSPAGLRKEDIVNLLLREEYGYLPTSPDKVMGEVLEVDDFFCAGKAVYKRIKLSFEVCGKEFSFPISYTERKSENKQPLTVQINFRPNVPDKYQPTEEIIDSGHSIMSFYYEDVTFDNDDFTNGLAGIVYKDGERTDTDCGKIGLWAYAVMRVIDYAVTLPEIDSARISVAGHSRLGKTALLVGALDERVYCAYSNDSGCSGAAITREKCGEQIKDICSKFGYWFAKNYYKYIDNEDALPFDQHYLLVANIPHRLYVASAKEDLWADPKSEYKSCLKASPFYKAVGLPTHLPGEMPKVGAPIKDGYIGYHIREGKHYFSRTDWIYFLEYLNSSYKED